MSRAYVAEVTDQQEQVVNVCDAISVDIGRAGVAAAKVTVSADGIFSDPQAAIAVAVFVGDAFPAFAIREAAAADNRWNAGGAFSANREVLWAVDEGEVREPWFTKIGRPTEASKHLVRDPVVVCRVDKRADFDVVEWKAFEVPVDEIERDLDFNAGGNGDIVWGAAIAAFATNDPTHIAVIDRNYLLSRLEIDAAGTCPIRRPGWRDRSSPFELSHADHLRQH